MPLERVFIDTNILVSAIGFDGHECAVVKLGQAGQIRLVLADVVVREARRLFRTKFPSLEHRLEWELSLLDYEAVDDPEPSLITQAARVVRDPGDIEVLASILASKPDVALTGDKDLLTEEVRAIAPTCRCADYLEKRRD